MGKLAGRGSIFAIYADGPQVEWRRNLLKFADHGGPCAHCTRLATNTRTLDDRHLAFNAAADRLLAEAGRP